LSLCPFVPLSLGPRPSTLTLSLSLSLSLSLTLYPIAASLVPRPWLST
jgi:hypothetical protein